MPIVLIFGATSDFGLALAQSLLRSGNYTVWGVARSDDKANVLIANEMRVVMWNANDRLADVITGIISSACIDIVIDVDTDLVADAPSAPEQATTVLDAVIKAARTRKAALRREHAVGPKMGYVYKSGSWVHGSPTGRVSDLSPVGNSLAQGTPAKAVRWRPRHEQDILAARDTLDVAILRPANMYGRSSSDWGIWWGELLAATIDSRISIRIPADPVAQIGILHVDDAVSGFHAAIDRLDGRLGTWPIFDLVGETISLVEIMDEAKVILGVSNPLEYIGTQGDTVLEGMSILANTDGSRARLVLGWEPKRNDFLQNLSAYIAAWEVVYEDK